MLSQKFPISFQLFQLLYQILLVAHICGCGFHYVGLNSDEENNWIVKNGLKDASFFENYVISIYFAIISMITVGFGDITPINTYERIYVIFQTCFSCGIFAFAINTIGSIVKDKQTQIQELKANKNLILTYMKDRNISKQNQNKVIRFLEYSHRNQNDNPQKGKQLIQNMGKSVRDEIYFEFFTKVISQIPLFTNYFTDKVKQEVSSQFSEAVYGTGDCIIQQGKPSKNLYFVVTGEIYQVIKLRESSYNSQQQQITIQVLKQGDTFDDESFLSNLPCKYEYISKNTSQVAYLQKDVFVDILQNYRQDYEQYCTLVHNIRLKNEHNILKECKSCNNKFHSIINCPLLHYEVNRELLLKRYICDQPQKRQDFCRKMKRSNFGNVKYMRNQLRFFRLRLPKNFVYDSQIFDEGHLDIQQNNEFYQLLEYEDDEIFISCSPQLIFSKSQNEIVWLLDEDDTDMQYMGDDIDQSQLNEGTYNSFQLYAQKRRNALFVSKKTLQDDSLKQKKDQEPKFNRSKTSKKQQNQKKQQKTFNSAFSSDFKNYNEFDKYDDSFKKNKRNINLFKQSFVQLKSKSLTSLCNDYCDQISEGTHIIANEDQHISNSEPLDDKIYSKTEIQRNRKSFKDLKKLSIKTQTQTMNIDDSQRLHQQNIQQILPINNAISEFQIPSNQLIQDAVVGGIVDSEKIVSYQTIQNQQYSMCLSPLLEEQPIRNKAQSSISQLPKVKINQKNSQQTLIKNGTNQQMQINQQNQQGLINTSNLLNIKNPQLSPKRNSINFVSGQQNAIGSMINSLGSSLIQKNQSKLSFQNELNPYQPSSNTSNSQLRELSSYSKRSSNQNKQNNQYQQQQSLTGIQQHQQHSIQSFIGNQSHNQLQSFNMILSRQLSNFSSSNKTKKTKGLQTKLNSIVSQNKNEDEQNLAGVEEEEEEDQNKQLTHQQSNFEDQIYTEAFETLFVIPQFESMKLFQNFLPHNNYDLVLENYKTIQHLKNIAQKKSLKTSRKPRKKFGSQNLVKKGRPRNKRKLDLELSPQQLQHSLEEQFLSSQKGNNAINMLLESCKLADK